MPYRFFFFIFFLFCSLLNTKEVYAQTFNSFNEFNEYIQNIMLKSVTMQQGEEVKINVVQLDSQMKPPSCSSEIEASVAQPGLSTPANSVILECNDTTPWKIYVPVQIKLMTDMVAAARRIVPGEMITENDVLIQKYDKYQVYNDYFYDKNQTNGLIASHVIPAGGVLSKKNLKQALMIQKNQNINLILKHGSIEIGMSGIAKSDGYLNDKIKVLNPTSKKMVDAQVVGLNSAQIEY